MPFNTPGVYVQEIPSLPPSVAEVSTAIPAFIGYVATANAEHARITSLLEYRERFGMAPAAAYTATLGPDMPDGTARALTLKRSPADGHRDTLYYAVAHYFMNGGGPCWIVPIGGGAKAADDFAAGLAKIAAQDEPTILLFPEAIDMLAGEDHATLAELALQQCAGLKDRFTLLDVADGGVDAFRSALGPDNLSYGAAYYPHLRTTLSPIYDEATVTLLTAPTSFTGAVGGDKGLQVGYAGQAKAPRVEVAGDGDPGFTISGERLLISGGVGKAASVIVTAWNAFVAAQPDATIAFTLTALGTGSGKLAATEGTGIALVPAPGKGETLASLRQTRTALYNRIKEALARERMTLPPSAAVAGIYASVDRDRGVWKAPANVGVTGVIAPTVTITDEAQDGLNVDPTAGKSINAIRSFTGRGTLVWGARTLAGNDNEWRYVPVRRLFITIEESTRKASAFAVFEPNDATTWLKVKGMIESYLYGLWERGALAGSKPEQAYAVNVGLGRTMTAQDVLEGRMIVEIAVAAVRPAEFIILRFSHLLQQS